MSKYAYLSVVVLAFALTGCTGTVDAGRVAEVKATSAPSEAAIETSGTPVAAPIAVGEPAAEADPTANFNGFGSQREWYLRSLDDALSGEPPSDDDLIGAGMLACDQLRAGTPRESVQVVDGGTVQDNANITGAAIEVYCPELA